MITRYVVVACVLIVPAGEALAQDAKKKDQERLQGEWVLSSMDLSGMKMDRDWVKKAKLRVEDGKWVVTQPSGDRTFEFKIDPTKRPKEIDLLAVVDGKEVTWRGIYRIVGDTLTFCRARGPDGERPRAFKPGTGVALIVYKRAGK